MTPLILESYTRSPEAQRSVGVQLGIGQNRDGNQHGDDPGGANDEESAPTGYGLLLIEL